MKPTITNEESVVQSSVKGIEIMFNRYLEEVSQEIREKGLRFVKKYLRKRRKND